MPEHNRDLLRRARRASPAGGHLLLLDLWTDPTHTQSPPAALLAGEYLSITGGAMSTARRRWRGLGVTGWQPVEHRPVAGLVSAVVAEAAG